MGSNAYLVGSNTQRDRTPKAGPSPFSKLAAVGFGNEDAVRILYEKQLAVHVLFISIALQLISLIGWSHIVPLAIEACFGFLITVGCIIAYLGTKDHKHIRAAILLSGIFYALLHFFSQGCTSINTSGGRMYALLLPTMALHVNMGGDVLALAITASFHVVMFFVNVGVQASNSKCYTLVDTPAVTNDLALTAVEVVLPLMATIALTVFDAKFCRESVETTLKSEAFAKNVLRIMMKQDYNTSQLSTLVEEYDQGAEGLSYSDEAIILGVQTVNKLRGMMPAHLRGAEGTPHVHEIKRKNSLPNLNGGLNPPKDRHGATTPLASQEGSNGGVAPSPGGPGITFVQAFEQTEGSDSELEDPNINSGDESQTNNSKGGRSPVPPPGTIVAEGESEGEDPFTPAPFLSVNKSADTTRKDSPNKSPLSHSPSMELSGSVTKKRSIEVSFLDSTDGTSAPPQGLRRRQSMVSGKFSGKMVLEPSFLVVFTLPRMTAYATRSIANLDLMKLVFDEFADNARKATEMYDGRLLWHSFTQIYAKFPDVFTATCAALCMQELMKRDAKHKMDRNLLEAKAHQPFIILLHAHLLSGIVGTDGPSVASMGASPADHVVSQILEKVAMQTLSPPAVVAPTTLQIYLEDDFVLEDDAHDALILITGSKNTREDGLPLCTSEPPYINISNTEVTDFEALCREFAAKVISQGAAAAAAAGDNGSNGVPGGNRSLSLGGGSASMGSLPGSPGVSRERMQSSVSLRSATDRHRNRRLPPEVIEMWNEFDSDKNGYLDREEVREVLIEMGITMTDDELKIFFDSVDADKSGTVTLDEFQKSFFSATLGGSNVMSHIRRAATAMARNTGTDNLPIVLNAWKKYDADGSGSLESDELFQVLKDLGMEQTEEEVEWLVQFMDKNGNGSIEFDEFAALFSEDNTANLRLNAVRERIQTVTRVMSNKSSGKVYSNAEQDQRDQAMTLDALVETFFVLPIFMYILYNFGINIYRSVMGTDEIVSRSHMIADLVLDYAIYGVWVFLKLVFLPREINGQVIFKRKEVMWQSIKLFDFWLDIIVLLPVDIIYFVLDAQGYEVYTIGLFRLNKILAIYHFDNRFLVLTRWVNPPVQRVANALSYFVIFAHLFACGILLVARDVGDEKIQDMIGEEGPNRPPLLSDEGRSTMYMKAFYWAILTMAGQLKGEPLPEQDKGLYLALAGVLVGLPMFTVILGTVGNAVNIEDSEAKFLSKLDDLRGYFSYTKMPLTIETECVAFYRHLFNTTGTLDITDNPLDELPVELTVQVTIEIGRETLRKVPIFAEAAENLEFVHELTSKLVPRVLEPAQVIMKKGDRGTNMYFLTFGEADVLIPGVGVVFTFKAGGFFGEIALLHNSKRTATIAVSKKGYANVLTLDKKDFEEVAETFPQAFSSIHKAAGDRIEQIKKQEEKEKAEEKEKRRLERLEERKKQGEENPEEAASDDDELLDQAGDGTNKESSPKIKPNMVALINAQRKKASFSASVKAREDKRDSEAAASANKDSNGTTPGGGGGDERTDTNETSTAAMTRTNTAVPTDSPHQQPAEPEDTSHARILIASPKQDDTVPLLPRAETAEGSSPLGGTGSSGALLDPRALQGEGAGGPRPMSSGLMSGNRIGTTAAQEETIGGGEADSDEFGHAAEAEDSSDDDDQKPLNDKKE